jgi:hypothetical protein
LTVQHDLALDTSLDIRGDLSAVSSPSFPLLINSPKQNEKNFNNEELVFNEKTISLSQSSSSFNDDDDDHENDAEHSNNSIYERLKMDSASSKRDSTKSDEGSNKNEKLKLQSIVEAVGFILFPSAGFINRALKDLLIENGMLENFQ